MWTLASHVLWDLVDGRIPLQHVGPPPKATLARYEMCAREQAKNDATSQAGTRMFETHTGKKQTAAEHLDYLRDEYDQQNGRMCVSDEEIFSVAFTLRDQLRKLEAERDERKGT